jgi:hypothetical protein
MCLEAAVINKEGQIALRSEELAIKRWVGLVRFAGAN